MFVEAINSIKAKLYDFTYTPFMSSVVIAWILLNHKYLLKYFTEYELPKKLELLNSHDFSARVFDLFNLPYAYNFIFPLLFGLFYVFLYPKISKVFYGYTLEKNKELKKIKQKIEDETPLTQEEAREIRGDLARLTADRDKYQQMLIDAEEIYKKRLESEESAGNVIGEYTTASVSNESKIKDKLSTHAKKLLKEVSLATDDTIYLHKFIGGSSLSVNDKTVYDQNSKISEGDIKTWTRALQELVHKNLLAKEEREHDTTYTIKYEGVKIADIINDNEIILFDGENKNTQKELNDSINEALSENALDNESDETKTLRYLYESNYQGMEEDELLNALYRQKSIPRPKAKLIINNELIEQGILEKDSYGYLIISDKGNNFLINKFDRSKD